MNVSEWLALHPHQVSTVLADSSVEVLLDMILASRPASTDLYVVDDDGVLLGHIPAKMVLSHFLFEHQPRQSRRELIHRVTGSNAAEIMEQHFPKAELFEEMETVLPRQLHHDISELAVVDEQGKLCGVIDLYTLAKSLRSLDKALAD